MDNIFGEYKKEGSSIKSPIISRDEMNRKDLEIFGSEKPKGRIVRSWDEIKIGNVYRIFSKEEGYSTIFVAKSEPYIGWIHTGGTTIISTIGINKEEGIVECSVEGMGLSSSGDTYSTEKRLLELDNEELTKYLSSYEKKTSDEFKMAILRYRDGQHLR